MKYFKKYYKYVLLFLFFLFVMILFSINGNDAIWNYGMAHAIRIGEIPYKDFNIISTPLYAFIMCLGLFISDTFLTYLIEQALLCTLFIYLVEKLLDKKYLLIFICFCFPIYNLLFPNYNFMVLLLLVLLLYLEKRDSKDSIIGIILGLLILSKHTIGCFVLLFSLISTFNIRRSLKRLVYSFIPLSIFFIYLLFTGSLYSFIDLSLLGLFDFGTHNSSVSIISIIISLGIFIYTLVNLIKNYKNKYLYYLLSSMIFVIPICDFIHACYLICFFLIVIFINNNISISNKKIYFNFWLYSAVIFIMNIVFNIDFISHITLNNGLYRFRANILDKRVSNYVSLVLEKYNSYEKSYMISMTSMFFDLESNHRVTYFDIPLYGNFGYNGIEKMKSKIDKLSGSYFFIKDDGNGQFVNVLNDYIRDNYRFIEKYQDFDIYFIE